MHRIFCTAIVLMMIIGIGGVVFAAEDEGKKDKTGTNPVNFQNEVRLYNNFMELPDGAGYINTSVFRLAMPFDNRQTSLRLELPMVTTDVSGDTDFGFGDLSVRWLRNVGANQKRAWVIGTDIWLDTATKDTLGAGKDRLGPVVFSVKFLSKTALFAPAYQYIFDVGGSDDRPDVSVSALDLYYVTIPKPGMWIMVDPTITYDHEIEKTSAQVEVEFGAMMNQQQSFYIRPGVPIGGNRGIDWNLEVGVKTVF